MTTDFEFQAALANLAALADTVCGALDVLQGRDRQLAAAGLQLPWFSTEVDRYLLYEWALWMLETDPVPLMLVTPVCVETAVAA